MFHKEGHKIIFISMVFTVGFIFLIDEFVTLYWLRTALMVAILILFVLILQFFRNPKRNTTINDNHAISPVDGKVVVIEEVFESDQGAELGKDFYRSKVLLRWWLIYPLIATILVVVLFFAIDLLK